MDQDEDIRLLKIGMSRMRRQLENSEIEIVSLINELDKMNNEVMKAYSEKGELLNEQRRRNDEWAKLVTARENELAKAHAQIDNQAARISNLKGVIAKLGTHIQDKIAKNYRHPQEPVWDAEDEAKAAASVEKTDYELKHEAALAAAAHNDGLTV